MFRELSEERLEEEIQKELIIRAKYEEKYPNRRCPLNPLAQWEKDKRKLQCECIGLKISVDGMKIFKGFFGIFRSWNLTEAEEKILFLSYEPSPAKQHQLQIQQGKIICRKIEQYGMPVLFKDNYSLFKNWDLDEYGEDLLVYRNYTYKHWEQLETGEKVYEANIAPLYPEIEENTVIKNKENVSLKERMQRKLMNFWRMINPMAC